MPLIYPFHSIHREEIFFFHFTWSVSVKMKFSIEVKMSSSNNQTLLEENDLQQSGVILDLFSIKQN